MDKAASWVSGFQAANWDNLVLTVVAGLQIIAVLFIILYLQSINLL